jgi:hypothetical protein
LPSTTGVNGRAGRLDLRAQKLFPWQALDVGNSRARETQLLDEQIRGLLGVGVRNQAQRRSALHDRAMEQAFRGRRREQRRGFRSAAGLPEDHHARRIAAERRDVVAHPLERRHHVHDAAHARALEFLGRAERRQMGVAEAGKTMVDGDDHDVAEQRELTAVVHRTIARARGPAAAVEGDEDRSPGIVVHAGRPHVQRQAVFAHATRAAVFVPLNQLRVVGTETRRGLRRNRSVADAVPRAGPGGRLARRHEPVAAAGVGAVGNAAEDLDPGVGHPAHDAVRCSTSKKSGPFMRAGGLGVWARSGAFALLPMATTPARLAFRSSRRDCGIDASSSCGLYSNRIERSTRYSR